MIRAGFGWKTAATLHFGIFAAELGHTMMAISDGHCVLQGQTTSSDRALFLAFDDREWRDDQDDRDAMLIHLDRVDPRVDQILICLFLFPKEPKGDTCMFVHHLGMASDYYLRLVDEASGKELVRYDVREKFDREDVLRLGRLYRTGSTSWEFEALGQAHDGGLLALVDWYVEGQSTREEGA